MVSDTDISVLAVDAGNTRIKWGIHDGRGWIASGAVPTDEAATLAVAWRAAPGIHRAIASNVAGPGVAADLSAAIARAGIALQLVESQREQLGVANGYRDPGQLGSDRWAALIAAHRAERGHKLVVNVGTAMTVDALTADGQFLGGLIVPGPALMRRSLDRGTAGLRQTEGTFHDFPRGTPDAITSGAVQACAGAIERMRDAMVERGTPPGRIILSGGAAAEIEAHLPLAFTRHESLVLDGLLLIARNP